MKRLYQLVGLVIAIATMSVSAQAAKVYFNNPWDWTTVKAYFYKGAANNEWPGQAMTKATGDECFSIDIPAAYEGGYVIFNNGEGGQYPAATGKPLGSESMVCWQDKDDDTKSLWTEYNAETIEVYFDNSTENWATPNYYYFGVKGKSETWPGAAMTLKEGKIWKCTLPAGTCGVIFNDGAQNTSVQSGNFAAKPGHTYSKTADITSGSTTPVGDPFTVYFDNGKTNWGTVKVHYFGGTESSTWPGVNMTLETGKVFKYTVPAGTTGLVFNDGSGNQSGDFEATANHVYDNTSDKGVYTPGDPGQVETPAALYILGTVGETFWATTPGITMTKTGNVFAAENVEIKASAPGAEFGYLTLVTKTGADWDAVNSGDRYGAAAEDAALANGVATAMQKYAAGVDASSAKSWKLAPGKYTISADFATMKVTATLTGSGPVAGNGSLAINNVTINPGRDATLEVSIATDQQMKSLQFDVELPSCVSAGAPLISRDMAKHKLLYNTVNGKLRIVIFSETNEQFNAQNGALVYLPVSAATNAAEGTYNVTLSGIAFADENLMRVTSPDVTGVITVAAASDYTITLNKTVLALQQGQTAQLEATVTPHDGTDETITWTSATPTVATVSNTGLVTAESNGTAVITASCKGATATCTVYVGKQGQTITWEGQATELAVGGEDLVLTATATSGLAVSYLVINDTGAATIVDGKLHAVSAGIVTVKATQEGNDTYAAAEPVSKTFTITLGYVIGDADGNGTVQLADATTTINYILGYNPDPFNIAAANVNGDKDADNNPIIDVVDVALIVDMVLSQTTPASPAPARVVGESEQFAVAQTGNELFVTFSNMSDYVATLFEITLPEGVDIVSTEMMGSNHEVLTHKIGGNTTRVVAYSIYNNCFCDEGKIRLVLNESKNAAYRLDNAVLDSTNGVTTVESRAMGVEGTLTGIEGINADNEAAPVYFNLQGVRVENPASGLYIRVIGNEVTKVIVK